MNALDLARWQFGITTIYHFLFMPLSIGLSLLIAIMQTAWFRTGSPKYLAMTRYAAGGRGWPGTARRRSSQTRWGGCVSGMCCCRG